MVPDLSILTISVSICYANRLIFAIVHMYLERILQQLILLQKKKKIALTLLQT